MVKILDRYLFREILLLFFMNLGVLTVVLTLAQLLQLTELVVQKGVPLASVFLLLIYLTPSFLAVTLPMAQLVAIVMAFSRLTTDLEITVLRASGVGLVRLMRPMIVFSLIIFVFAIIFTLDILPRSNHAFRRHLVALVRTQANVDIRARVFNDYFPGVMLYVDEVARDGKLMRGVLISDTRNPRAPQTIIAHEGVLVADPSELKIYLRLKNGSIHGWEGAEEKYDFLSFSLYDLTLSLGSKLTAPMKKRTREMTVTELTALIKERQAAGESIRGLRVEFHQKLALPFAVIILGLIGAPLGLLNQRSGRFGGMVASLAVILTYYLLLTAGKALGSEGVVSPIIGVWAPNVFLGVIGLYLMVGVVREAPFTVLRRFFGLLHEVFLRVIPRRFLREEET